MAFVVPEVELRVRASRAGGPGGQHVNKSATRIEVVWNVATSPSLSDEQRARLLDRLRPRLDRRGRLRVVADEFRSQARNRTAAVARLRAVVAEGLRVRRPRKPTKPTAGAVEQRLGEKHRRAARKRDRQPPADE
jgi:ribosome-associated protein